MLDKLEFVVSGEVFTSSTNDILGIAFDQLSLLVSVILFCVYLKTKLENNNSEMLVFSTKASSRRLFSF